VFEKEKRLDSNNGYSVEKKKLGGRCDTTGEEPGRQGEKEPPASGDWPFVHGD